MKVLNYTEFRKHLTKCLNKVTEYSEMLIVSRSNGKTFVVMSLEEFNSINETLHVVNSTANKQPLDSAIKEMEQGKFSIHALIV